MDEINIEEHIAKMLSQPKAIESDGQKIENHSLGDLIRLAKFFASKNALSGRKCPLRITKMKAGGGAI